MKQRVERESSEGVRKSLSEKRELRPVWCAGVTYVENLGKSSPGSRYQAGPLLCLVGILWGRPAYLLCSLLYYSYLGECWVDSICSMFLDEWMNEFREFSGKLEARRCMVEEKVNKLARSGPHKATWAMVSSVVLLWEQREAAGGWEQVNDMAWLQGEVINNVLACALLSQIIHFKGRWPLCYENTQAAFWRGPHSQELRPPVNSQNDSEPSWNQIIQPPWKLWVTYTPAHILSATSWETVIQNTHINYSWNSWPTEIVGTINGYCCFKMLVLGVICYAANGFLVSILNFHSEPSY